MRKNFFYHKEHKEETVFTKIVSVIPAQAGIQLFYIEEIAHNGSPLSRG